MFVCYKFTCKFTGWSGRLFLPWENIHTHTHTHENTHRTLTHMKTYTHFHHKNNNTFLFWKTWSFPQTDFFVHLQSNTFTLSIWWFLMFACILFIRIHVMKNWLFAIRFYNSDIWPLARRQLRPLRHASLNSRLQSAQPQCVLLFSKTRPHPLHCSGTWPTHWPV